MIRYDAKAGDRSLDPMRWGLVPYWAKDLKIGYSTFNAKAEGIERRPTFREAFARRRCLVALDAFYEWKKRGKDREPYAIARADRGLMAMAGLWENWRSPAGEWVRSVTIVTTTANAALAELHDRMPVILDPDAWPIWLGEKPADAETLKAVLTPCPPAILILWPVDRRVGNVNNKDPALIEPSAPASSSPGHPGDAGMTGR